MANSNVDDINVKISEKYKPPFRISMPMSYSQRLTLNKQLQDSRPSYDFHLEKSVLENMQQWKEVKTSQTEERKERLELARKEFDERIKKEQEELNKIKEKSLEDPTKLSNTIHSQNYLINSDILMPTPISTSNILTPVSMSNTPANFDQTKLNAYQKPFNLSDFEYDTSSPFDNMELKSINDMEELAQVLKSDRRIFTTFPNTSVGSTNYSQANMPYSRDSNSYNPATTSYSQFTNQYNPGNSMSYNVPSVTSNYSHLNGYYYSNAPLNHTPSSTSHQNYTNPFVPLVPQPLMQKSSCKSVPDLVKSLEKELDNTHLNSTNRNFQSFTNKDVQMPIRPKSTDAVYPKVKVKSENVNLLDQLTETEQDLCRRIGGMGFPLDRVARVMKSVGDDQKKIVEHLLALSELLDLGFQEKDASDALLRNNNDRDKALDVLIS